MRAYCIFDDFPVSCVDELEQLGISVTVLEKGHARPTDEEMGRIFENYNIVIIGTSQKISTWMWEKVFEHRIVATTSVGIDHIKAPEEKRKLLTILNTPRANAQSVAEYTVGAMLMARKRFSEGDTLYSVGLSNKNLIRKPEDIQGSVVGLVGTGRISTKIMELLCPFGVNFLCFTRNPERHANLSERFGAKFVSLETLTRESDIISVNIPSDNTTKNLIHSGLIVGMKEGCIFVSVSRKDVVDINALIEKAEQNPNFYAVLDLDILPEIIGKNNGRNIIITPHIAGGTIETRKRMFTEVTKRLVIELMGE